MEFDETDHSTGKALNSERWKENHEKNVTKTVMVDFLVKPNPFGLFKAFISVLVFANLVLARYICEFCPVFASKILSIGHLGIINQDALKQLILGWKNDLAIVIKEKKIKNLLLHISFTDSAN